jgi:hypothetical protein
MAEKWCSQNCYRRWHHWHLAHLQAVWPTDKNRLLRTPTAPHKQILTKRNKLNGQLLILPLHSFSSLSYDMPKASSKASSPHSAIQSFLFQMRVSSPFLKVIQYLPTSSYLSSCYYYPPLYLSFGNPL